MRIAVVASHPVQYQAPLFRELAQRCDLHVLFAHKATAGDQAVAGFNVGFEWDVDLASGYQHSFLRNVSSNPGLNHFAGCDTPEVGAALRRLAPDAVVVMGWHLKCYWQTIWACRRAGIPVMARGDSHLETPRSALKRLGKSMAYPVALRAFDAALYVGEHSRRYWEHYRYPKERMFFSPHCVDNDWFATQATGEARQELRKALGLRDGTFAALFAGKLEAIKRVGDVIEAASACRRSGLDIEVVVAGAGALQQQIELRAKELCVPAHMLGFCNQSRMPFVYAGADALVLASESETWGLVANEALACGTPIVISDACGCAPDLAADATVGRSFRCADVADLARNLLALNASPPSRAAISAKLRRYSLATAADGIVDAVRAVTGDHRQTQRA